MAGLTLQNRTRSSPSIVSAYSEHAGGMAEKHYPTVKTNHGQLGALNLCSNSPSRDDSCLVKLRALDDNISRSDRSLNLEGHGC